MPTPPKPPGKDLAPSLQPILWPQTFSELATCAERWARTEFVPKIYQGKPDAIIAAVQMGSEIGLSPFAALRSIAVINGMPTIYGDGALAICKASPHFVDIKESVEGADDERAAVCVVQRKGATPVSVRFSMADAKKAKLASKPGPWQEYPDRMLQMRARGFALRDQFPDVLRGLITREEAEDYPPEPPTIIGQVATGPSPSFHVANRAPQKPAGAAQAAAVSNPGPASDKPQTPPQKVGNGDGAGNAQFRAWFEQTWNAIDAAPSLAHAVTVLRQALKPEWTGPILEKIKLHEQWEWKISQSKYGAALNAFLEEQMAERDRQQAGSAPAEEPQP